MTHENLTEILTINAQVEQAKTHLVELLQQHRGFDCLTDEEYDQIRETYIKATQKRIDTLNQELEKL